MKAKEKKVMKIKRLFIETDVLHQSELRSAQRQVAGILEEKGIEYCENVFDETQDFAWHDANEAWEAVKRADEIYGDSALIPICGIGTYTGAPVVMDVMMAKTIEEKIEGKSMYFLRKYDAIQWDGINQKLLKKAFIKNKLFTMEYDEERHEYKFIQVDIEKLKPNFE